MSSLNKRSGVTFGAKIWPNSAFVKKTKLLLQKITSAVCHRRLCERTVLDYGTNNYVREEDLVSGSAPQRKYHWDIFYS